MPNVNITLNGRNFDIACGPGEEERVKTLAGKLGDRMETILASLGPTSETLLFAVTALILTDELDHKTKETETLNGDRVKEKQQKEMILVKTINDLASRIESVAAKLEAQ